MAYLGNNLTVQQYSPQIAYFNGTGSQTAFTLPVAVVSAAQIIVAVENVIQNPSTAFSVAGTTLTFTSAPPSGSSNIWVEYTSLQTNAIAPSHGTVQNSSFGNLTSIPFAVGGPLGGGNSSIMKNRIINGAMVISQRNGTSTITPANGDFIVDRFSYVSTQASKVTSAQSSTAPTGFTKSLLFTSSSAYSAASGDLIAFTQAIEGFNIADLGWGTASAKTITLSFQVYSSLTGTFGGSLRNDAANRCYVFSYSIPVANTWTTISVTIAGDTTGTWATDNTAGIRVYFNLGCGTTYSGAAGSWGTTPYYNVTGGVNLVGTNGATFYITGAQLEVGSSATGFEYRQYQQELSLCQRYYIKTNSNSGYTARTYNFSAGTLNMCINVCFPITMRANPTCTMYGDVTDGSEILFSGAVDVSQYTYSQYQSVPASGFMDLHYYTASAEL